MKTFQQILEQFVNPQVLFNIAYGAILISPILGGEFTALLVLIGYINFLYIAKGRAIDPVAKVCIGGLTISAIAVLILALVHLDDMLSGLGKPVNTIISVGWFGVFFMLLDAVRTQIYKYDIDLQNFARFLLTLIFITLLVKMGWIYFSAESIELRDFFTTSNRKILLVNLNPNHADNIIVFQIVMIVWALFKLERDGRTALYMMVAFAACAYLVYLFMVINSRAGLIGCFMAIVIAILMNSHRLSKSGFFILFCFAIIMPVILPDSVISRIQLGSMQIIKLYQQSSSDLNASNAQKQTETGLRKNVINILKQGSEEPDSRSILALCFDYNLKNALPSEYNIDPNISFRFLLYRDGYNLWKKSPIWGHGNYDKLAFIEKYSDIDPCRIGYFSHLHNYYLNLAVRGGIFALICFTILSGMLFYLLWKSNSVNKVTNPYAYLPVLMFFVYLYVENLFDISMHRDAPLSAILFGLSIMLAGNLKYPMADQENRIE